MAAPEGTELEVLLLALLAGRLAEEDDPMIADMLYRRLRSRMRRSERWDPEIDEILMHSIHRGPFAARERRMAEMREIATSVLEGFRHSLQDTLHRQVAEIGSAASAARAESEAIAAGVEATSAGLAQVTHELHTYLWMVSVGADLASARMTRFIPARLYVTDPLPDADRLESIVSSLNEFVRHAGLARAEELPDNAISLQEAVGDVLVAHDSGGVRRSTRTRGGSSRVRPSGCALSSARLSACERD